MSLRGRGAVRQWTKTCSEYDGEGNATEILYQTVSEGKIYEIHATPHEVIFCISPRRQFRLVSGQVLEALGASNSHLEDALDENFLLVDKPLSVSRFQSLISRFPNQTVERPEGTGEEE